MAPPDSGTGSCGTAERPPQAGQPTADRGPGNTVTRVQFRLAHADLVWPLCVLLGVLVLWTFLPALRNDFVWYDDGVYVTENRHVQQGLTWETFRWAFHSTEGGNYLHPLTWLSHILDCQLFGLKPWGHHLTSVLLHTANAVLVFLVFRRLTGATWRSLCLAALFGLHPLRVESVAWVAERKDVLSTFFGLLALLSYAHYAQGRSKAEGRGTRGEGPDSGAIAGGLALDSRLLSGAKSRFIGRRLTLDYGLTLFFFACGLMSKPMVVTLPFVLLLLDYWPLQRIGRAAIHDSRFTIWRLVREKVPFFILAAVASVAAFIVQKHGGAMMVGLPFVARLENALVSYCRYLGRLFWPVKLAVFYPHPGHWPTTVVLLSGFLLAGISVLVIALRRQRPYLLIGWFWFLGTLVPVIGLVQVGDQAMADRYSYVPFIGLFVILIWSALELTRHWRYQAASLSAAATAVVILCMALTRQQIGYWKDSEALFRHAITVTENNHVAHFNLGVVLGKQGRLDEAISQFQAALRSQPGYIDAHNNLGIVLARTGRLDEAVNQYREALRLKPDFFEARCNLGIALGRKGQLDEAISQFQEALKLAPHSADIRVNLGTALYQNGRLDEAISEFKEASRLDPDSAEAHNNLGVLLVRQGRFDEAIGQFQQALRLKSDYGEAYSNLAAAQRMKDALVRQPVAPNQP